MTIDIEVNNRTTAILKLSGRLDTANAPLLEQKIKQWGDEITELVLDFDGLDYISSMGLRVLLNAKKASKEKNRQFVIKNISQSVREVFELTGFVNLVVREEGFAVLRRDEPEGIVLYLNGEMANENITVVLEELAKIKENGSLVDYPVTVILDMEKLYCMLPSALKQLRQAIADTAWRNRNLFVRNVPKDYLNEIGSGGFGQLVEGN
ncbi:MAG: STAS domain-containing protein [Treponema sp.]|nr:STAS domain-containing protein [Treponema sp.]